MAEHSHDDQWRKNIPADFEGRQAAEWDGEIDVGVVYKSAVAIVIAVVVAFVFCWFLIDGFAAFRETPQISPLAEAQVRHLPPSPQLRSHPEAELTALRAEVATATQEYGWADQSAGRVHIPVAKAIDLVLAGGKVQATAAPVPTAAPPTDAPPAAAEPAAAEPSHAEPAHAGAPH